MSAKPPQYYGLATIPITNAHVSAAAGIAESKLNLDFGTLELSNSIANISAQIGLAIDGIVATGNSLNGHAAGTSGRHAAEDIDTDSVEPSGTVESSLIWIYTQLVTHLNPGFSQHHGMEIAINSEDFNFITSDNVQDALEEVDDHLPKTTVEAHQGWAHKNAVSIRTDFGQENLTQTTLACTAFRTNTGSAPNILQVMRPNVARVTSGLVDLAGINATDIITIDAGGIGRVPIVVDLDGPYGSIDEIVEDINDFAHADGRHYPISAYNTRGRLTIAHCLVGAEYTITIVQAPVGLGFSEVIGDATVGTQNHSAIVDGHTVGDLRLVLEFDHVLSVPNNTIAPNLGDLGVGGRVLCYITNHTEDSDENGVYYITDYVSNTAQFVLNRSIAAGTFRVQIFSDSVSFENSFNFEVHDVFLENYEDGYGQVFRALRASTNSSIGGIRFCSFSKDFPTQNVVAQVSSGNLSVLVDSAPGDEKSIPSDYIGKISVFAPDNINKAIFRVFSAVSDGTAQISMFDFAGTSENLHLCAVAYSEPTGEIFSIEDKRVFGSAQISETENDIVYEKLENVLEKTRNNGVIYGLECSCESTTQIGITGGEALVGGRIIVVKDQIVTVNAPPNEDKIVLLDAAGIVFVVHADEEYAYSALVDSGLYKDNLGYVILATFATVGDVIDCSSLEDRRLIVSNIDKRLAVLEAQVASLIP